MASTRRLVLAAGLALAARGAWAAATLTVAKGWSRPAMQGMNGAGFLTLTNRGAKADILIAVESPAARKVEVHRSGMANGVMTMAPAPRLPVPAGGTVKFAPGGYHLMLLGLARPLRVGDVVPVTLRFSSGAVVQAGLTVALSAP